MHSVHFKRIPKQAKIRSYAESASLLSFFDFLCCFGFHKKIPKFTLPPKNAPKISENAESATVFAGAGLVCGNHKQIIRQ